MSKALRIAKILNIRRRKIDLNNISFSDFWDLDYLYIDVYCIEIYISIFKSCFICKISLFSAF